MQIKADEIRKIIRQQIEGSSTAMDVAEVGTVLTVGDGIARIYGLEKAMYLELIELPNDVFGMILNLEDDSVGAVLFGETTRVKEGDQVKTGQSLLVMESMKMETTIVSPRDGVVQGIQFAPGQTFDMDAVLVTLEPEAGEE